MIEDGLGRAAHMNRGEGSIKGLLYFKVDARIMEVLGTLNKAKKGLVSNNMVLQARPER